MDQIYKILLQYNCPAYDFHTKVNFNFRYKIYNPNHFAGLSDKAMALCMKIQLLVLTRVHLNIDEAIYNSLVVDLHHKLIGYNRNHLALLINELIDCKFIMRLRAQRTLYIVNPYIYNRLTKEQAMHLIARLESLYEATVRPEQV